MTHKLVAAHIRNVQSGISKIIQVLLDELVSHDVSKWSEEEYPLIVGKSSLDSLPYTSDEYQEALAKIPDALDHHYANNRHHPEHFENSWKGMDAIDVLVMLSDWHEVSENMQRSIDYGVERWGYSEEFKSMLEKTARRLGWMD